MPKKPTSEASQIPRDLPFYDVSESWADFFDRLKGPTDGPRPVPSAEDIRRAIHFWRTYPGRWAEVQQNENGTAEEALWLNLDYACAERVIMAEAERRGIPSAAIRRSGALCQEGLANCPALGTWPHVNLACWPECLQGAKQIHGLREDHWRSIREAQDVIARLEAMLDAEAGGKRGATPAAEALADEWSRPMALTELADRLLKDPKKTRKLKSVYKDRLRKLADKSWVICLDGLAENLRREIDRA